MRVSERIVSFAAGGIVALAAIWASSCAKKAETGRMSIVEEVYGKTAEGEEITLFTLTNESGIQAKLINFGAILTELHVPDRSEKLEDVVLGFDSLDGWLANPAYFNCTTGRCANRIAGGRFTLNGKEYELATNDGPNHLHGGVVGLNKRVWKAEKVQDADSVGVKLDYLSPDGEEGYPGNLQITVIYTLSNKDELKIDYTAKTDQATPVNLTNHTYFNLGGQASGTILDHELMIAADHFTPVDETLIPTGEIQAVAGTDMDFTKPTAIGARIGKVGGEPKGYDHNYVLRSRDGSLALAARVRDPKSGRVLEISTTQPGVQLYTGNFLDGSIRGKGGVEYPKHAAFCLETQHYPDAVNQPDFPSVILRPGETYRQTTVHRFYAQ
ncbi:MAG: galactose mutarotase [Planctomycetes bacterium]|nr:galactose mutarotase [Planctomycetota bacterium]